VIVTKLGINRRVGGKIISNRYLYNKGWYMNATMGQPKIVEDNVINYELGINGLSNFKIDKLGRVVIISISNSDSNKRITLTSGYFDS